MFVALALASCADSQPASSPTDDASAPSTPKQEGAGRGELLSRQWIDHTQRCGENCQYRKRGKSTISVNLSKDGRVEIAAQGQVLETFRAATGKRRQLTDWERRWEGKWEETDADKMQLKLEQSSLVCERERDDGATDRPCVALDKLELSCERIRVRLESKRGSQASWTWTCSAKPSDSIELPLLPWVFGDEGDVAAVDVGVDDEWKRRYLRPKKDTEPPTG